MKLFMLCRWVAFSRQLADLANAKPILPPWKRRLPLSKLVRRLRAGMCRDFIFRIDSAKRVLTNIDFF